VKGKENPSSKFDLLEVVEVTPRAQVEYEADMLGGELGPYNDGALTDTGRGLPSRTGNQENSRSAVRTFGPSWAADGAGFTLIWQAWVRRLSGRHECCLNVGGKRRWTQYFFRFSTGWTRAAPTR
jgi:hypothetical protein